MSTLNSPALEAPRQAMTNILSRHDNVRALLDNGWLHLFAFDEEGQMAWRYVGDLQWAVMNEAAERRPQLNVAV